MAVLCAEMQGEFQIRKTWKRMCRAGAEAPASPIATTARTGAVARENPPRGVNDADSPTLNFVEETNFGVLRDETLQHDPELQLNSALLSRDEVCCDALIDNIAASLDISCFEALFEVGQQTAEIGLDPQICCAQVMVAKAG